jgi:AraC-like DNA-binding protein
MKFHASHDRIFVAPSGDEVALIYDVPVRGVVGYRHFAVYCASVMISLVRAYTGANWHPLRVEFDFQHPRSLTPYEDLFCCPVVFDRQCIAIIIERDAMTNSPVQAAGPKTVTYSDLRRIAKRPAPRDLVSKVRESIRLRLLDEVVDIDTISKYLAIGPRTLQRRLNDEGTAFRALVSQVRAERAFEMLRETELPLIDIAVELGYSSSAHFSRAFSKTTGVLPNEIRRLAVRSNRLVISSTSSSSRNSQEVFAVR